MSRRKGSRRARNSACLGLTEQIAAVLWWVSMEPSSRVSPVQRGRAIRGTYGPMSILDKTSSGHVLS